MGFIESMQEALPEGYASAILWLAFALLLLVAVLALARLIRGYTGGTFVAGGRNRRTRLAVMDAAAIDSRRRLVLVRRDDVEHLVMIGGPSDIVIERDIRMAARAPRLGEHHDENVPGPVPTSPELERARAQVRPSQSGSQTGPRHAEPPRPAEPTLPPRSAAVPQATLPRASIPMPAQPPVAPLAPAASRVPAAAARPSEPAKTPGPSASRLPTAKALDDELLKELTLSLEPDPPAADKASSAVRKAESSLDEQMNRLLGEISRKR
jgi:hypothetical protein